MTAPVSASAASAQPFAAPQRLSYPASQLKAAYVIERHPSFDLAITRGDGVWTVTDRPSGIYGAGDTPEAALLDFRAAAREHLEVLEASEPLAPGLEEQLEYLRERIRPSA